MSNFFKDSNILALRWCKKLCRLPLGLAETTIGQPACYGQWARLFVMLMLPLLPNINNSFKLLQFNIPLGRYNSKIESYFNNNEKWLHCLLFVAAGFAPLLKAWSQCCIRVQCWVLVFNQLSLSGRRLLMSFHINFILLLFYFLFYITHDMDSSVLWKISASKISESESTWVHPNPSKSKFKLKFIHNCSPSPSPSPSTQLYLESSITFITLIFDHKVHTLVINFKKVLLKYGKSMV